MESSATQPVKDKENDEYVAKLPGRKALRVKNQEYWDEDPFKPKGILDSSLKKHTTLLNRLRTLILSTPAQVFIKEMDGLTLTKYTEEIVAAVVDGIGGGKGGKADVDSVVEVITYLHSRLTPTFLASLLPTLLALLSTAPTAASAIDREKEEKDRISRMRPVLRVVAELGLVGAWEELSPGKGKVMAPEGSAGGEQVLKAIQGLMASDPAYTNIPLFTTFLKSYMRPYFGSSSAAPITGESADGFSALDAAAVAEEKEQELVPAEIREKFRKCFAGYFAGAAKTLVKGHTKVLEQDKKNYDAYVRSGEIFEDRQQAYEKMTKAVERLQMGVQGLSDLLGLPPPVLPTSAANNKSGLLILEGKSVFGKTGEEVVWAGSLWEDEEEKKFYEDIVDLAEEVPAALLGFGAAGEVKKEEDPAEVLSPESKPESIHSDSGSGKEIDESDDVVPLSLRDDIDDEDLPKEKEEEEVEAISSGPAARLNAIFAAMPEATNRNMIDKLAVDFAFLNSKGARKRMIKFLGSVPKNRSELLPHYSRLAATLNRYMPDIGKGLIEILDEEFRYLQRKKTVKELQSVRLKNVRYYGELAKFRVAPSHTVLHVLKVYLEDMTGFNIDNTAAFLETCGKFLLRSDATSERMKSLVDVMRRKQVAQNLDQRQQVILENAFYICNPPERVAREQIEQTPMELFVQHLLHDVLAKKTIDKVLKLLRKLHWEDPVVYELLEGVFTRIWNIKFSNIPMIAMLVYDLQRYHPEFTLNVLDQVLEDIRAGMEDNIFKYNQRRISTMKYLGELYMYRVVNTPVIFDVLWSLISFGHAFGLPVPGRSSTIDAKDDFFRVRLICTLLDTCGACFNKGSSKKKLDHYLVVFQLYILCKDERPMDVDFMISDTLESLRPKLTPYKTFQEAALAVDELQAEAQEGLDEEDSGSEGGSDAGGRGGDDDQEDDIDLEQKVATTSLDDEEDERVVLIRDAEQLEQDRIADQAAEDEFNRDFAKMLADTTKQSKTSAPAFDMAVPLIRKAPPIPPDQTGSAGGAKQMQFSLLSKKGNKQQIRTLAVPVESALAQNHLSHQMQSEEDRRQLKLLTLENERRQENDEKAEAELRAQRMNRALKTRMVG